jgi:uncharacterized membrane protein YoaK (UPF0700 family)
VRAEAAMLVLSDQGPAWPDERPKYAPEVPCRFVTATVDHDRILPALLLALTAVAGLLDAVCYLALGHVLTANMTGNVVFLGFAAAGASGLSVARSGLALLAFLVGSIAGGRLATMMAHGPRYRWIGLAFGAEAALLLAAALAVVVPAALQTVIALTGVAMGVRNATVRKLAVPDLTTTVLTLTVTSLAADSALAGGENPRWARRLAAVATMVAGAAAGTVLVGRSACLALAVCAAASAACAIAAWYRLGPR